MLYNFIIVDDCEFFLQLMAETIEKSIKGKNFRCNIYKFNDYNDEFFKNTYKVMQNKVYILDIETPSENGINVASRIRKFDNDSIIIFVSAYESEYLRAILKSDTNYFCSIHKKDIQHSLKIKLNKLYKITNKKLLKFRVNDEIYSISEDDIFYVEYLNRKTYIITENSKLETNYTLSDVYKMLSKNSVYSHRSCIVNMLKVIDYSLTNKEIKFSNNISTDLISRKFIQNLDNFYNDENNLINQ